MLPDQPSILQSSASTEDYALSELRTRAGYHPQYARNTLQLNRGGGRFSDIGLLAGVHATDWSWAPLLADLDDDGRKDLFVTSGIYRRPNDLDYIDFVGQPSVQAALSDTITSANLALLRRMPQLPAPNRAFRNVGGLRFTDATRAWGLDQRGFSNGAAYVDLDNRGTLDLVVNAIGAPAAIYRNRGRSQNGNGSLTVRSVALRGTRRASAPSCSFAPAAHTQLVEQSPTRGFQSSVDPRLHVGLGRAAVADSVIVVWPDRRFQVLTQVPANRRSCSRSRMRRSVDAAGIRAAVVPRSVRRARRRSVARRERVRRLRARAAHAAPALHRRAGAGHRRRGWRRTRRSVPRRQRTTARPAARPASRRHLSAQRAALDRRRQHRRRRRRRLLRREWRPVARPLRRSAGNQFEIPAAPMRGRLYLNDGHGRFTRDVDAIPELYDNGDASRRATSTATATSTCSSAVGRCRVATAPRRRAICCATTGEDGSSTSPRSALRGCPTRG